MVLRERSDLADVRTSAWAHWKSSLGGCRRRDPGHQRTPKQSDSLAPQLPVRQYGVVVLTFAGSAVLVFARRRVGLGVSAAGQDPAVGQRAATQERHQ